MLARNTKVSKEKKNRLSMVIRNREREETTAAARYKSWPF